MDNSNESILDSLCLDDFLAIVTYAKYSFDNIVTTLQVSKAKRILPSVDLDITCDELKQRYPKLISDDISGYTVYEVVTRYNLNYLKGTFNAKYLFIKPVPIGDYGTAYMTTDKILGKYRDLAYVVCVGVSTVVFAKHYVYDEVCSIFAPYNTYGLTIKSTDVEMKNLEVLL